MSDKYSDYLLALTVPCMHARSSANPAGEYSCGAQVGQPCRSVSPMFEGKFLSEAFKQPVHESRITFAKKRGAP